MRSRVEQFAAIACCISFFSDEGDRGPSSPGHPPEQVAHGSLKHIVHALAELFAAWIVLLSEVEECLPVQLRPAEAVKDPCWSQHNELIDVDLKEWALTEVYRAPQRAAIGALLAAGNEMKVSLSDAMEHSGITGRTTSEDAAVQSLNNFLRSILKMHETFKIAFLTVLDGPCHDQLVLAEKPFIELRNLSNNPLFSGTHTAPGFKAFMMKLFTASEKLDADLGYLVELAQERLRPARPFFSRKSTQKRHASIRPADADRDKPSASALQAALILGENQPSTRERVDVADRPANIGRVLLKGFDG